MNSSNMVSVSTSSKILLKVHWNCCVRPCLKRMFSSKRTMSNYFKSYYCRSSSASNRKRIRPETVRLMWKLMNSIKWWWLLRSATIIHVDKQRIIFPLFSLGFILAEEKTLTRIELIGKRNTLFIALNWHNRVQVRFIRFVLLLRSFSRDFPRCSHKTEFGR